MTKGKQVKGYHSSDYGSFQNMMGFGNGMDITRCMINYYKMYRINSDLHRCITELQETAGKSGYKLQKHVVSQEYYKDIIDPNVDEILNWGKGWKTLKNEIIKHYQISGNVFIEKLYDERSLNRIVGYNVLDTRYMSIVCDAEYNPVRYIYRDIKNNRTLEFQPETILHFGSDIDSDNPAFYMSKLEGIVPDVLGDEQAAISNAYFFQNDAMPSSLYILEEGLTIEQQTQVMDFVKMQFQGGHNKHKNLISGNVRDIKPISQSHTDMDYLNQRKFTTERVCACMGVPKVILNYTEGVNYTNADMQYTKFIENTIRPLECFLTDIFTKLIEVVNSSVEFVIIDDHIDDKDMKSKIAIQNIAVGLWSRNEGRIYIGDDIIDDEVMDEHTVPNNIVSLEIALANPSESVNTQPIQDLQNGK